jgi:hypothetical protein
MLFFRGSFNRIARTALLAISFILAMPMAASARGTEPNTIDPVKDAAYISTLGLSGSDWNDPIINIMIVGQDALNVAQRPNHVRPNGEHTTDLSTHADSDMLLSFNKRTGIVSILSIYRGYIVSDDQWAGVTETPTIPTDRYLANYYLYAGRVKYIDFARHTLEGFIRSRHLERQYFAGDRLKIHGLIETGFDGFKAAINSFMTSVRSTLSIASASSSQLWPLAKIFANHDELLSELRSQGGYEVMTEKRKEEVGQDPSRAILGTLRERQRYPAGGYQRAFNHAKFVSYVLGYVASFMADGNLANFLQEPAIISTFNGFSRTFSLANFDSALRTRDRGLHMIARTGFRDGVSPMYIVQIGTTISGYAVYNKGQAAIVDGTGFIQRLKPDIQLIPKPNDCTSCPR